MIAAVAVSRQKRLAAAAAAVAALMIVAMFSWEDDFWPWRSRPGAGPAPASADRLALARQEMVESQLRGRDITNARVLAAMQRVERHRFIGPVEQEEAYDDHPLPIGHGQTISQPYIVALMAQLADPKPTSRALEVGSGCGYQAAVLAELAGEVYGIEILEPLEAAAEQRLAELGYRNVMLRCGDGYRGWPEHAPYDCILVSAAAEHVPQPLLDQLAPGGRLVIPVGAWYQNLLLIEKQPDGSLRRVNVAPVAFVPLTGEAQGK